MIAANELRIGNIFTRELRTSRGLEYEHDFVLTEEMMGKLFGESIGLALQDLFPIPLTPEILGKCGFETDGFKQNGIDLPETLSLSKRRLFFASDYLYIQEQNNNKVRPDFTTLWNKDLMKQFYLHQLQNLYFALTGTELNYQP